MDPAVTATYDRRVRFAVVVMLAGSACSFTAPEQGGVGPRDADFDGAHGGSDAPTDAPEISEDAPGFDPATCPANYTTIGGSGENSAYYVPTTYPSATWTGAESACEQTRSGNEPMTHLVVFDTPAEREAVMGAGARVLGYAYMWTGNYQVSAGGAWTKITTGAMTDSNDWATGEPSYKTYGYPANNPNGAVLGNSFDSNGGEYQAQPFNFSFTYICECDGKAVTLP